MTPRPSGLSPPGAFSFLEQTVEQLRDVISAAGHNPDSFCYSKGSDGCWRADALRGVIVCPEGPTVYLNHDGSFDVSVGSGDTRRYVGTGLSREDVVACLRGLSW